MEKHYDSKYLLLGVALALGGFFLFSQLTKPDSSPVVVNEEGVEDVQEEEDLTRRFTDGVFIPEEDQPTELYAVMIENSAEAWPLIGLADARFVFEAPVEGAIPRFMAFYDNAQEIDQIGPVRSARPYYVEWANGFDAMYAHVGGSPEGLQLIRTLGLKDLNEFFWGQFFWRATNRFAPHNVYTSTEELQEAYEEREFADQELALLFTYEDDVDEEDRGEEQFITIPFSGVSSIYDAGWSYSPSENTYQRYQGKEKQEEMNDMEVFANNIIVMFSDISVIDDIGRRRIRTTGEGDAILYKNGTEQSIRWQKDSQTAQLRFIDENEEAIALNAGPTWIEVVRIGADVTVEQLTTNN